MEYVSALVSQVVDVMLLQDMLETIATFLYALELMDVEMDSV